MNEHADKILRLRRILTEEQNAALDALLAEREQLEHEVAEWKAEAERSKWPKEAAQDFHRFKAERQQAIEALRRIANTSDPLWGSGSEAEFARDALAKLGEHQ